MGGNLPFLEPECSKLIKALLMEKNIDIEKICKDALKNLLEYENNLDIDISNIKPINIQHAIILLNKSSDCLLNYAKILNEITNDFNNSKKISRDYSENAKINNLVNLCIKLIKLIPLEILWKENNQESPIGIKLYESCAVLLFAEGYSVYCDRAMKIPLSPININEQTLWKRPTNPIHLYDDDYINLIENRYKIIKFLYTLFQMNNNKQEKGNAMAHLFAHKLSKNIQNFVFSSIGFIVLNIESIKNSDLQIVNLLKIKCLKCLVYVIANSFVPPENTFYTSVINKYFEIKKSCLNLNQVKIDSPEIVIEILQFFSKEVVDSIITYTAYFLFLNNIFSTNDSNSQEEVEINYDKDSKSCLNLIYIIIVLLYYKKEQKSLCFSDALIYLFEDVLIFLTYNRSKKVKKLLILLAPCLLWLISSFGQNDLKDISIEDNKMSYDSPSRRYNSIKALFNLNPIDIILKFILEVLQINSEYFECLEVLIYVFYNLYH